VTRRDHHRLRRAAEAALVLLVRLAVLALIAVVVYALIVLGIGEIPTSRQWTLLAFSALAAALVALAYARFDDRVAAWARALINQPDGAQDDVVRLFSRRAAGGLPLDELLAALVESLGTGLALTAAEVWTYSPGVLQLAAAEPSRTRPPVLVRPIEEATLYGRG
jgi:Na+/phosphate symporter